ncbi:hypothetical protein VCHC61A2_3714 [Vibrio cholerae HC-61A2]|nr:hypothetical protein VCHC61A2_3714 [Vibrio cholerae HC-61A2]
MKQKSSKSTVQLSLKISFHCRVFTSQLLGFDWIFTWYKALKIP